MKWFRRLFVVLTHVFTLRRKIALFDIDRTSYEGLLVADFFNYQYQLGIIARESFEAFHHTLELYNTRVYTYEEMADQLLADWADGLRGYSITDIEQQIREFFQTDEGRKFFSFVRETIVLLSTTHDVYFVTAEPQFVAGAVTEIYQTTGYCSSVFEVINGVLTGKVTSSLGRSRKKDAETQKLLRSHKRKNSFAFGDSEGDEHMLAGVEHPICVNPTDGLRTIALRSGWTIAEPEYVTAVVRTVLNQ